jgi:hypothetical protein
MKRRILFSIVLVVSIVSVSLMSSDSRVEAQNQIKIIADTGVITLGPNQKLVMAVDASLDADIIWHEFKYGTGACTDVICKHAIVSQNRSNPIHLTSGEAVSLSVQGNQIGTDGTRVVVLSNSRNPKVNALIVDMVTGNVVSLYVGSTGEFF